MAFAIIGLTGALPGMPPAASYSFLALSGLITLTWVILIKWAKGQIFKTTQSILVAAISSNPKPIYWP